MSLFYFPIFTMIMNLDTDKVKTFAGVGETAFEIHKVFADLFVDGEIIQDPDYKSIHPIPFGRYSSQKLNDSISEINKSALRVAKRISIKGDLRLSTRGEVAYPLKNSFPFIIHPEKYVSESAFLESIDKPVLSLKVSEEKTLKDLFAELIMLADCNKCEVYGNYTRDITLVDENKNNRFVFRFFVSHEPPNEATELGLLFSLIMELI